MKRYTLLLLFVLVAFGVRSQNSIGRVLESIEQNNKDLQANGQLTTSQKLEARIGNSLADPTVTYEYVKGNKDELGKEGELTVAQSFDFPTVYTNKNKVAGLKAITLDKQHAQFRQDLLLQAKELCLDLIALNQQKSLLDRRQSNASQLLEHYQRSLALGTATILEVNKIELELLNVKTEYRMNEASRQAKLRELQALNGGIPINFTDSVYMPAPEVPAYDMLQAEALSSNLELQTLQSEQAVAKRSINLSRSEWLPKFELGYKHTHGKGEQFNGVVAGISIPLYENRHKVRQAKAQNLYTEMKVESTALQLDAALRGLYDQLLAVKASLEEYNHVADLRKNIEFLDRALAGGQLSTIDYFVELATVNQSLQNYIQLENQYQKLIAQIYKFQL